MRNRNPAPGTAFIACAALGKEIREIVEANGWDVDVRVINARLHMVPERIPAAVEEMLDETAGAARQVVVYGHCGASALDPLLEERAITRTVGPHCYEIYGGDLFAEVSAEAPGTFYLTDFLVRAWQSLVVEELGLDRDPRLRDLYFHNYTQVVYFSQTEDDGLLTQAAAIAEQLGLPLVHHHTGYGDLERRLSAIMADEPQPTSALSDTAVRDDPTV